VVHHSAATALPRIAKARADGLPFSAETCPHYLHFAAERIPDGATAFKCAPPIREDANRDALWSALAAGTLDLVASDHSPCNPSLKALDRGDFVAAWGGISGVQLALPVTWTEARRRGHTLAEVVRWMCAGPARLAGLTGRTGATAPGHDADLVIFDADARFVVEAAAIQHRHRLTPYVGDELAGVVRTTYLRGVPVWDAGRALATDLGSLV
jgi:allantoinase